MTVILSIKLPLRSSQTIPAGRLSHYLTLYRAVPAGTLYSIDMLCGPEVKRRISLSTLIYPVQHSCEHRVAIRKQCAKTALPGYVTGFWVITSVRYFNH